jgi:cytochrome c-type biogenesis protein
MTFLFEAPLAFGAGLVSVLSPCVLPVLPIIVTGGDNDHRSRPLMIVLGLALTFVLMGIASALIGSLIAGVMPQVERAAGVLIVCFGVLLLFGVNPFKRLGFLSKLHVAPGDGRWSGLALGMTLGVIWIPCVGPVLSGILAQVAGRADTSYGIALLTVYAAGFAVPMLAVGYLSHGARQRLHALQKHQVALRLVSGGILIVFGIVIATSGMLAFSF